MDVWKIGEASGKRGGGARCQRLECVIGKHGRGKGKEGSKCSRAGISEMGKG